MTDFLLAVLAFTQIPIIFIFTSRTGLRLADYYFQRRNPDWLAAHPEFKRRTIINAVARGVSYLIGAVSAIAAIKYVFITPNPNYHVMLLVTPLALWVLGYLVYAGAFYMAVLQKIPAPKRRQASLTDRRLSKFVPPWVVYLCYGCLALILMIYAWALLSARLNPELAITRLLGFSSAIVLGTGVLMVTLRRKNSEMEHILGSGGRKVEVIASMAVLYLTALVGIYLILSDFFNISVFSNTSLLMAVGLLVQIYFLAYCLHPKVKTLLRNSLRAVHPTNKLPANHYRE